MQPRERKPGLSLDTSRCQYLGAGLSRQPGGHRQQRRLPDPGFTADDQRPAGALGQPTDEGRQDLEFALPPVQRSLRRGQAIQLKG